METEPQPFERLSLADQHLVDLATGQAVDPTADQFRTAPDYSRGIGKGFLTSAPSKRARAILAAI